jgi:hypothetical protein
MKPSCPRCKKSEFSYRALLSSLPYRGELSPVKIICPSCGASLRVTAKSRLAGASLLLGSYLLSLLAVAYSPVTLQDWQLYLGSFLILGFCYLALWPLIVRFKPWTPFQYWLPKSRLVGYTVYLLLPIGLILFSMYAAAKLGVGM